MSHKMWPADFNKLSILQTTDEIEIDRRNEIEHISINRSTGERRRRFSVLKVWSDYFTIDLKMAEKSV
jgi:hypothetical protein